MQTQVNIVGEIIAERWQILEYLGEGSMSYVYKAQDTETGKTIILKLIKSLSTNYLDDLESFSKQAKSFIALNHESIASYYNVFVCDKGVFLFCDYLHGESLSSLLSKAGKLPLDTCIKLLRQIVSGLEYAHERNIIHGDLKPSNVYIVNDQFNTDEAKILDFGCMRLIERIIQTNKEHMSSSHPIFADSPYVKTEQRLGQNIIDEWCDLYALGCLMYELASGKPPFISKSSMETTYKQKNKTPTELEQLLPAHPLLSRYQLIANKLLCAKAQDKYQSVSMVGQDLDLLTTAKEKEWKKRANVFKKTKLGTVLAYKWQIALVTIFFASLVFLFFPLASTIIPYYYPWKSESFDNKKLWHFRDDYKEKPSARLIQQKNILTNKLNELGKVQGQSSPEYIRLLFSLTQFLLASGQFNEALTKLSELQKIESISKIIDPAELYADIAFAQYALGNFESAEEAAKKVLQTVKNNNQVEAKVAALKVLGDIDNEKDDINQAEKMYEQMYNLAKNNRLNNATEYAYASALLADIWRRENKLKESEKLYKEAIDWGANYVGQRGLFLAKACYGLALLYYQEGNLKAADFELKRALPIAAAKLGPDNNFVNSIRSLADYILFHEDLSAWCKAKIANKK